MFGKKKTKQVKQQGDASGAPDTYADAASAAETAPTPQSGQPKKKKKGRKKKLIAAIIILLAVAVGIKMTMGDSTPVIPIATDTVSRMDIQQIISMKGTVEGNDRAEVTSALDREITSISVKEGDVVTKGQVLATLEDKEENKNQKYEIEQAENNLQAAKFDYDTSQKLYEEGAISQQDYIKAQTAYQNAQTALASARETDVDNDKNITSPISGIVTRVNAKVGFTASQMQSGTALFVIEDLSSLKMEVKASEYDIANIRVGQSVEISAEVLGNDTVEGVVSHIAPTGELKDASGKEMVVPVKIDINPNDKSLIAGVTAKADILVAEQKNAIAVALDALLTDPATGETYLFVVKDDNTLSRQVVTTGLESDFFAEITSDNIKEGDVIVSSPTADMTDGMTVVTEASAAAVE